jgi:3-methyladenine DNA glycosylase/8-oxoguanine DNA glycosylase
MRLPSAEIELRARGRFDLAAIVRAQPSHRLAPFVWRSGAWPALLRAERLPQRGVYLLRVRPRPGGVALRATGVDANQVEVLAPLAARMRRALRLDENRARTLRGTTLFEDLVKAIACSEAPAIGAVERLGRLGSPCPANRRLRAFPTAAQILRAGVRRLRRQTGLGPAGTSIVALARGVERGTLDLGALEDAAAGMAPAALARRLRCLPGVGTTAAANLHFFLTDLRRQR